MDVVQRVFRRLDLEWIFFRQIAQGVIAAVKEVGLQVPLVVRLEGTNVELGKKMLAESKLNIVAAVK